MLKLLLVENNVDKCKNIVNILADSNLKCVIYKIAYSVEEAIIFIKKYKIDVIVIENKMCTIMFEKTIMENISNTPIIILSHSKKINIRNIKSFELVDNDSKYKSLINLLYHICLKHDEKNTTIKKIYEELKKLRLNLYNYGTMYMAEAIYELYLRKKQFSVNMTKEIYPIIGKKYGKSANTVYSNIKNTYFNIKIDILRKYLGCCDNENPTIKDLMYKVMEKIS